MTTAPPRLPEADTGLEFCPVLAELMRTKGACLCGCDGKSATHLMASFSTVNNLLALRAVARDLPMLESTLEIGMAVGGSTLVLAQTHADRGNMPTGQHIAVDPFQPYLYKECALIALEMAGLREHVKLMPEFSRHALPALEKSKALFDLIYIDGSHLFDDVFVDFYYANKMLRTDGVVFFDDCAGPHVTKVLRFIKTNLGGSYTKLDLSRYRTHSSRLRHWGARVLGREQLVAFRKKGEGIRDWDSPFSNF